MRAYSRYNLADRHRPPINLVVSNVPGPREPLYIAGARIAGIWSMGPILESIGLNVTVWSYLDQMNFGVVASRSSGRFGNATQFARRAGPRTGRRSCQKCL